MMIKRLLLLALLLFPLTCIADGPYNLRIGGLDQVDDLIPNQAKQNIAPKLIFNTYVPGIGRIRIKLHKVKEIDVQATITDKDGNEILDNSPIKLFRGVAYMKSKEHEIAGSVYYINGLPYLHATFQSINPRSGKPQLNKLRISLSDKKINQARLMRVKKLNQHIDEMGLIPDALIQKSLNQAKPKPRSNLVQSSSFEEVEIAIDADQYWNSVLGSSANSAITSYLNEAEVIYENDMGITFNIVRQNVFTSKTFGSSAAEQKLCNYQVYVSGSTVLDADADADLLDDSFGNPDYCAVTSSIGPQSYYGTADVYHLFTGQDLDGGTIGVAFLGVICNSQTDSFGINQYTTSALTPITFVHELGHNFGAIHDNSTSYNNVKVATCPATAEPMIMGASVGATPPESFSDCSKELVAEFNGIYGSCLSASSGGGGGGDSGGDADGDAITLSVKLKKSGKFTANVNISDSSLSSLASCKVRMMFESKKKKLDSTAIFSDFDLTGNSLSLTAKNRNNISPNKKGIKQKGFVVAKLICDNEIVSESSIRRLKPAKINSPKEISIKKWLKKTNKKLKLAG